MASVVGHEVSDGIELPMSKDVIRRIASIKYNLKDALRAKLVTFAEDDSNGYLTGTNPDTTDSDGVVTITYHSGTTAREVTITATAQQS